MRVFYSELCHTCWPLLPAAAAFGCRRRTTHWTVEWGPRVLQARWAVAAPWWHSPRRVSGLHMQHAAVGVWYTGVCGY